MKYSAVFNWEDSIQLLAKNICTIQECRWPKLCSAIERNHASSQDNSAVLMAIMVLCSGAVSQDNTAMLFAIQEGAIYTVVILSRKMQNISVINQDNSALLMARKMQCSDIIGQENTVMLFRHTERCSMDSGNMRFY